MTLPLAEEQRLVQGVIDSEDLSADEKLLLLAESGRRAGWDDPLMDDYDKYDENRKTKLMSLAETGSEKLNMTKFIHGKIHGRRIELTEDPGFAEGQEVQVSVRIVPAAPGQEVGQGFLRTEGALADDPHWDAIMEEIHQERKNDPRREIVE